MPWKKLGLIYHLPHSNDRLTTHMQGPSPLAIGSDIRLYYAARNTHGRSYAAFLDVSAGDPLTVTHVAPSSVLPHGPQGTFDDEGIMPACALWEGDSVWMYYSGWNRRVTIPYHNTTGLAQSTDSGRLFKRMFDGPILERTHIEPDMAVTPWVMKQGSAWHMWYVSGTSWTSVASRYEPIYAIKYASSDDGIIWSRSGGLAIRQHSASEACARPSVVLHEGTYHMWFCYRSSVDFRDGRGSYRIGYAHSSDGLNWERNDRLAGIDVSEAGWDSKMICYPAVLEVNGALFMFYNGNGFGQSGIGCAVWEGPLP